MNPLNVTLGLGVLQFIGALVLVPVVKRELSSLRATIGLMGADVRALKHAVGEVDAMVASARHGVELLVKESLDRTAEWESAVKQ